MAQKYTRPSAANAVPENQPVNLLYDKSNYVIFGVAALVVAIGFVLMSGTTDIYNNTKTVVAPCVVLIGFGLGFYALLKKPAPKV